MTFAFRLGMNATETKTGDLTMTTTPRTPAPVTLDAAPGTDDATLYTCVVHPLSGRVRKPIHVDIFALSLAGVFAAIDTAYPTDCLSEVWCDGHRLY